MGWFSKRSIWVRGVVFWNEEKRDWGDDGGFEEAIY